MRSRRRVAKTPSHPEVDQENATGFEANNQILAATLDGRDPFALELGGDGDRLERTDEARIGDLDSIEPPPDQLRLECEADRLDLGKLGHQLIVSSTIGCCGGASGPIVYAAITSS